MSASEASPQGATAAAAPPTGGPIAPDDALTPEFLLAAACCRWPPSAARDAAVRAAAARVVDWPAFLKVLRRQRVAGLASDALAAAGIEPAAAIAGEIAAQSQRIARDNLLLAGELSRLARSFARADIPVLALKGVVLAQLVYGSAGAKQNRDIDLLVPVDCAEAAMRLLEREGYRLVSPAAHLSARQRRAVVRYARDVEFVHGDGGVRLDLQWRLADNPMLLRGVDARAATQSVVLPDGSSVRTLAPDDLFAYLCVHGAYHAWSRLKWLADLDALIATAEADVARLYRHAQSRGAGLCAGQALLLCRRLFDLNLPAALAAELQGERRVKRLAAIAMTTMTAPQIKNDSLRAVSRGLYRQFQLGCGWRFLVAQCRAASVGIFDVVALPLPPGLGFLYPVVRLPLWLWRRTASTSRR